MVTCSLWMVKWLSCTSANDIMFLLVCKSPTAVLGLCFYLLWPVRIYLSGGSLTTRREQRILGRELIKKVRFTDVKHVLFWIWSTEISTTQTICAHCTNHAKEHFYDIICLIKLQIASTYFMADQRGINVKLIADGDNPEKTCSLLLSRSVVDPHRHHHHQDVHNDMVILN